MWTLDLHCLSEAFRTFQQTTKADDLLWLALLGVKTNVRCTQGADKTAHRKVSKGAKIRNRYN